VFLKINVFLEMEFKEFEPQFKSAKTRFKSAGLNLETFDSILSGTNHKPRLKFKPPLKFFGHWLTFSRLGMVPQDPLT